jgi:hypothetical protein
LNSCLGRGRGKTPRTLSLNGPKNVGFKNSVTFIQIPLNQRRPSVKHDDGFQSPNNENKENNPMRTLNVVGSVNKITSSVKAKQIQN